MKRILIYIAALAALAFLPVEGTDIGKLRPVEVVQVYRQDDTVVIATDTGDVGKGTDSQTALANIIATTPGIIYLDTAEYLLIAEGAEDVAAELRAALKKSVQICMADKEIDLALAAKFLPAHGKLPRLKAWRQEEKLPYLRAQQDRLVLENSE